MDPQSPTPNTPTLAVSGTTDPETMAPSSPTASDQTFASQPRRSSRLAQRDAAAHDPEDGQSSTPSDTMVMSPSASGPHQRQFVCRFCSKTFARLTHLQRHGVTHTDYQPFECSYCTKAFSRHDSLTRHLRLHPGTKRSRTSTVTRSAVRQAKVLRSTFS